MEIYKNAKIISLGKTYVIVESNQQGFLIYVPNVKKFKVNANMKVYVYHYKTEYTESIYGFSNFKERILFDDLIQISGIGPKTAMSLLLDGHSKLMNLIATKNIAGLVEYPYLGTKSARALVFELSDKYAQLTKKDGITSKKYMPIDAKESLKVLGFNEKQIKFAIKSLKPNDSIEKLVEEAIKIISNEQQSTTK